MAAVPHGRVAGALPAGRASSRLGRSPPWRRRHEQREKDAGSVRSGGIDRPQPCGYKSVRAAAFSWTSSTLLKPEVPQEFALPYLRGYRSVAFSHVRYGVNASELSYLTRACRGAPWSVRWALWFSVEQLVAVAGLVWHFTLRRPINPWLIKKACTSSNDSSKE